MSCGETYILINCEGVTYGREIYMLIKSWTNVTKLVIGKLAVYYGGHMWSWEVDKFPKCFAAVDIVSYLFIYDIYKSCIKFQLDLI